MGDSVRVWGLQSDKGLLMEAGGDFLVGTRRERGGAQRESQESVKRMGAQPVDERLYTGVRAP